MYVAVTYVRIQLRMYNFLQGTYLMLPIPWTTKVLNQACAWFLEIVFVKTSVYVCVCVRPQTIKNHSREMKPE